MSESASEFSAAPVGDDQLVAWPRVAAVSAMAAFSLPSFVTGLEVYHALPAGDVVKAFLIGCVIITVIGAAMATIGALTRFSSYLLVRVAFGDKGASIVNLAFAISLVGWFGVNIDLFSGAATRLSSEVFGVDLPVWAAELFAGALMTVTTIVGFRAINILASLLVPVLAIVTYLIIESALTGNTLTGLIGKEKAASLTMGDGVSAIVGVIIVGAIILPDITRFVRKWTGGIHTAFWTYMVVDLVVMSAAAMAGAASGRTDMLDVMLDLGLGMLAFIIVIGGTWVLNSFNLYSTALSVEATFPKWQSKWVIIGLGLVGIGAAFLNILDSFLPFLSLLAIVFVPVAGIISVDFFFIRRGAYAAETLENNRAFAPKAFAAWIVGSLIAVAGSFGGAATLSGIAVIDSIFAAGGLYALLSWKERIPAAPLAHQVSSQE